MRIWLDLSNSPHPLLFVPIARRLGELGHEVGVTARDNAQTAELTRERWPRATVIGGPSPSSRVHKARVMVERVRALQVWARQFHPDVALSHNSYGQILAARMIGVPAVTAMDYEGQPANHIAFRIALAILLPEALRGPAVRRQGATRERTQFYNGFKEEIYLGDFEPDAQVLESVGGQPDERRLIVARTPPTRASYHRFTNPVFYRALEALDAERDVQIVVLARHPEQREALGGLGLRKLIVPEKAIDSRSLIYHADLVLGAGGTMTREAALMGIPTLSVFAGKQPAVDRELERRFRLRRLRDPRDLRAATRDCDRVPLNDLRTRSANLVDTFVSATLRSCCADFTTA